MPALKVPNNILKFQARTTNLPDSDRCNRKLADAVYRLIRFPTSVHEMVRGTLNAKQKSQIWSGFLSKLAEPSIIRFHFGNAADVNQSTMEEQNQEFQAGLESELTVYTKTHRAENSNVQHGDHIEALVENLYLRVFSGEMKEFN